ncbi:MAG: PHP domain-containing protein [Gemmatimonadetes bacterium]|nr:PHP domain-containing protein [Gemmatimonadota bacterium]
MAEAPAGGRRLRLDMHIHTHVSFDSLNRPEEILRAARERGIDRLVITDHNELEGALRLREMDPERILIGEEVKTRERVDIIGIFLREVIPRGTPARETCQRIHEQGGVVYLPHPFDTHRAGGGRLVEELEEWIDVVEVHNARSWKRGLNERAEGWARGHGKLMGAGSDAHTIREIGRGFVELPPFEPTRESLLAALRSARIAGRTLSSPFCHLFSTYANLRKRLPYGER